MPKHMSETKRWELFIRTTIKSDGIRVVSVNSQDVRFTIDDEATLVNLNRALSDPVYLRSNIIHSLPTHGSADETVLSVHTINNIWDIGGRKLLPMLISEEFLRAHGVAAEQFIENSRGISERNVNVLNKLQFKQLELNINFLQSSLSNLKKIADILLRGAQPIAREDEHGEVADFAKSIIWLRTNSNDTYTIVFNHNLLIQTMQNQPEEELNNLAPVIAMVDGMESGETPIFSISRGAFLRTIHDAIGSNVIFREEENDQLQPIMFQPNEVKAKTEHHSILFHFLVDISGSMSTNFPTYQNKINQVIQKITGQIDNWKMVITTFNNELVSKSFDSTSQPNTQPIEDLILALKASGLTNLHGAIVNAIMNQNSAYENSVLVLFTDGDDTRGEYTQLYVEQALTNTRKQNSGFSMYSMGFGDQYNDKFFKDISINCGFTHIHLETIDQIDQFHQYIATLDNSKYIYEFVSEARKYIEQCAANDVAVASSLVNKGTYVSYNGENHLIDIAYPSNIDGFEVVNVAGDGNCLFAAIQRQLAQTAYSHLSIQALREMGAAQVATNPARYQVETNDIAKMFNYGEYADNALIQGLADALRQRINIHHVNGHTLTIDREGENYEDLGINLLYHNIHYLSLEHPEHSSEIRSDEIHNSNQTVMDYNQDSHEMLLSGLVAATAAIVSYCVIS